MTSPAQRWFQIISFKPGESTAVFQISSQKHHIHMCKARLNQRISENENRLFWFIFIYYVYLFNMSTFFFSSMFVCMLFSLMTHQTSKHSFIFVDFVYTHQVLHHYQKQSYPLYFVLCSINIIIRFCYRDCDLSSHTQYRWLEYCGSES